MRNFFKTMVCSLALCAVFAGVARAEAPKEINFGLISTESSTKLRDAWDPLFADMSRAIGIPVKGFFVTDYAGVIQGMRFNKVDIGWFGNKSAIEAVDRAEGEVIAQAVNPDGKVGYYSVLIAHKDSPYNAVSDVLKNAKDIVFGNGDPNSTSGYLVPGYYVFAKNGVDAKKIFKRTLNSSAESNALAVVNKQLDIATCSNMALERLETTQPDKAAQLKVVWQSPLIPGDPIVWRKGLDANVKEKIRNFLLNYGKTEEEKKILNNLTWGSFRASSNDQLLTIRQLELFKKQTELAQDNTLSEKDKSARLKTLDSELSELDARMKKLQAGK
ncbi:phosphonate ABC transporter substrate-binding protein [Betaproteobacteria bacterium]|nr:phosphonate ABC transporter substrate-binding protein [Betaproteobacteria bacterium]